jgi:hypothetical protein
MKKLAIASLLTIMASTASANSWLAVDVDKVEGRKGQTDSQAQYVRAGTDLGPINLGLQARTAKLDGGGLLDSIEVTAGAKDLSLLGLRPFVGVGHDQGFNGMPGTSHQYGLVGATAGFQAGPGFVVAGVKTRVLTEDNNPHQTVVFGTYALPVTKTMSVRFNVSRSDQDIKENAYGIGIGFKF